MRRLSVLLISLLLALLVAVIHGRSAAQVLSTTDQHETSMDVSTLASDHVLVVADVEIGKH